MNRDKEHIDPNNECCNMYLCINLKGEGDRLYNEEL